MSREIDKVDSWLKQHQDHSLDTILDYLQEHQASSWQSGSRIPAETYLHLCPRLAEDVEAVVDLIYGEFLLRSEYFDTPRIDEFLFRFPQHKASLQKQLLLSTYLESEEDTAVESTPTLHASSNGKPVSTGKPFGEFELHEEIGHGGMGVVYRAWQPRLKRYVALKMILSGQFSSSDEISRFEREAQHAATLDHPRIVPVYGVGTHEGHHYFTMRLMTGGTLQEHLAKYSDPRKATQLLIELADAVHHAHMHGILHRDLKPANVLFDEQGQPYLSDFGLARRFDQSTGNTFSQQFVGTPGYMAPEQIRGNVREITTAVDIHALGAVFYAMLTGKPPYATLSFLESMNRTQFHEPDKPRQIRSSIPCDLETICMKCLEKKPAQRYPSADALKEDLECYLQGEPIQARSASQLERTLKWIRRNPAKTALAGILISALIVVSFFYRNAVTSQQAAMASDYINRIGLAERDWEANRPARTRTMLDACPESMRGWEWHHLNGRLRGNTRLLADSARASGAHYTPDGKGIVAVVAGEPCCIVYWDVASGQVVKRLPIEGMQSKTYFLYPSPCGGWLVVGSNEQGRLYRVHQDRLELMSELSGTHVRMAAFDRKTQMLAVFSADDRICCYRLPESKAIGPAIAVPRNTMALAWNHDGTQLFSSSDISNKETPYVQVWDPVKGERVRRISGLRDPAYTLTVSPDGKYLAFGAYAGDDRMGRFGDVRLYNLKEEKIEDTLAAGKGHVTHLAFNATSNRLTAVSRDNSIRSWRLYNSEGKVSLVLEQHGLTEGIHHLHFHPDGNQFVTTKEQDGVRLWDARNMGNSQSFQISPKAHSLMALASSPDGKYLAMVDGYYHLHLWDTQSQTVRWTVQAHSAFINAVCFSPDGKLLATGGRDYRVRFWDVADGKPNGRSITIWSHVNSLAFVDDRSLVLGCKAGMLQQWDVQDRTLLRSFPVHKEEVYLAVSPDTQKIVSGDRQGRLIRWDLPGWTRSVFETDLNAVNAITWHPSLEQIAVAGKVGTDQVVVHFATASRKELLRQRSHAKHITGLAYSPDGKRFISSGNDQFVLVSDPLAGNEILQLHGHTQGVNAVTYSLDRRSIYSISWDGFLRKWLSD